MAENNDDEIPEGARASVLVLHPSHLSADDLVWFDDHGAGGDDGLRLARVPERGAEIGDEPGPLLKLFAIARRQRAAWLVLDEDGGAVLSGIPTYPAGESGE